MSGEPLPPPVHGSDALKMIVLKACAFHPSSRYASASEMLADLKDVYCMELPNRQSLMGRKLWREEVVALKNKLEEKFDVEITEEKIREQVRIMNKNRLALRRFYELMKLDPDVVFYNASQKEQGDQLRNAGFAAVAISVNKWEYNSIETLNEWIKLLSEIFPDNEKSELVANYSKEIYDMVQGRVAEIPEEERERVFFLYKYTDTSMETSGANFFIALTFSSAYLMAAELAASNVSPVRTISMNSFPNILTCSIFCLGVVTGMKMEPTILSLLQENATPCAWLPALAQTMPFLSREGSIVLILLYAPRILYERTI